MGYKKVEHEKTQKLFLKIPVKKLFFSFSWNVIVVTKTEQKLKVDVDDGDGDGVGDVVGVDFGVDNLS